jgi:nitrogen regulatory protein P-II 1
MKYVTCVIKPFRLDPIVQALMDLDVESPIITHVRGYGRQKGHLHLYRESEYVIAFLPKVMIEFAVEDEDLEEVIAGLVRVARTGRIGDGKLFVQEIEQWGDC